MHSWYLNEKVLGGELHLAEKASVACTQVPLQTLHAVGHNMVLVHLLQLHQHSQPAPRLQEGKAGGTAGRMLQPWHKAQHSTAQHSAA